MLSQVIKKTVLIPVQNQGLFKSFCKGGQCKTQTADYCFHHANLKWARDNNITIVFEP